MKIDNNKKILHLCPMKTATTTVHNYLNQCGIDHYVFNHKIPTEIINNNLLTENEYKETYKILFVRNPYARVVSFFFFILQAFIKKDATNNIINGFSGLSFEDKFIPYEFNDFIKFKYETNGNINPDSNKHMKDYIIYYNDIYIDFIGKVSNIENDIISLVKKIKPNLQDLPEIPKLNYTTHKPYQLYYTKYTQDLIYKIYKIDFILFNYLYEL